jgi:hypothetical protein
MMILKIGLGVTLKAVLRADKLLLAVDTPPLTNFTLSIDQNFFLWET